MPLINPNPNSYAQGPQFKPAETEMHILAQHPSHLYTFLFFPDGRTVAVPVPATELDKQYAPYVNRWIHYCVRNDIDFWNILDIAPDANGYSLSRLLKKGKYRELYNYRYSLPYGNEM